MHPLRKKRVLSSASQKNQQRMLSYFSLHMFICLYQKSFLSLLSSIMTYFFPKSKKESVAFLNTISIIATQINNTKKEIQGAITKLKI